MLRWPVVISGPFIKNLLHNHSINFKKTNLSPAMWIAKQILVFLFCFTRELNLEPSLVSICQIINQSKPILPPWPFLISKTVINFCKPIPPWIRHESAMNPAPIPQPTLQPFCLSGDNSWKHGRLSGIKKKHPLHPPIRPYLTHTGKIWAKIKPSRPGEATENHQIFTKVPGDSQGRNLKSEEEEEEEEDRGECLPPAFQVGEPSVAESRIYSAGLGAKARPWCQTNRPWCRQARHGTLENP